MVLQCNGITYAILSCNIIMQYFHAILVQCYHAMVLQCSGITHAILSCNIIMQYFNAILVQCQAAGNACMRDVYVRCVSAMQLSKTAAVQCVRAMCKRDAAV